MAPVDAALNAALRRLSAGDRALLELSLRQGVSDAEIATLLGLTADAVRTRRERLLERLGVDVGSDGAAEAAAVAMALGGPARVGRTAEGDPAAAAAPEAADSPPETEQDAAPEAAPETEQDAAPEAAPETEQEAAPEAAPAAAAEAAADSEPQTDQEAAPEAAPAAAPDAVAGGRGHRLAGRARSAPGIALLLLPGGLTAYLGFNAGGFFPGGTAVAAVVLCLALVLRITLADRPLAGVGLLGTLATCLLAAFALWTLLSGTWSDATGRALIEFDRALLYVLACGLFATLPRTARSLRLMLWGFALAAAAVCLAGLASRVLPDLVPTAPNVSNERLAYPVTYWNALGMVAALGLVACFHLAAAEREPWLARVFGAAAVPALGVTLFFTFSRGAIAVVPLALLVYAALGRPRGLPSAVLATVPVTAVALVVAYGADMLASDNPTAPAAAGQASRVALATGVAMAAAALLRLALVPVDARLAAVRVGRRTQTAVVVGSAVALVLGAIATSVAIDAPAKFERQYERFVEGRQVDSRGDARRRLTDPANNGRLEHWRVALDVSREARLKGRGAGTYEIAWARERPVEFVVLDAHSLYLETLAELGIVGLLLLGGALLVLLAGVLWRIRGPDRALHAAIFAMGLAWAVRAGIDWDWEMPVISLWFFAIGAAVLARPGDARPLEEGLPRTARVAGGLLGLVLALTPALIYVSQQRIDRGVESFQRGDCAKAIDHALGANSILSLRPEPFELLGYCDVRLSRPALAIRAMAEAVERDPEAWQVRYGLALVRAAAGRDPRPAAREALRLNPRSPLARDAVQRFDTNDPRTWKRRALGARLPDDF